MDNRSPHFAPRSPLSREPAERGEAWLREWNESSARLVAHASEASLEALHDYQAPVQSVESFDIEVVSTGRRAAPIAPSPFDEEDESGQ